MALLAVARKRTSSVKHRPAPIATHSLSASCGSLPEVTAPLALSFDCYGTLIDWETGIAQTLRPWLTRSGAVDRVDHETVIAAFGRHETLVESEHPSWLYPEILAETMRRMSHDLHLPVSDLDAAAFGRSVGLWPAFADSPAALARLKERFRLIILSNVDRVSFRQSNDRLGVEFDLILTAEDIGSYKPDRRNFQALEAGLHGMGLQSHDLLHVAESLYHDHVPAKAYGLATAWIHRRHDKVGSGATAQPSQDITPDARYTSLSEFADAILADEG